MQAAPRRDRRLRRRPAARCGRARTRSSPGPAGPPPRWAGPAATGSPSPRRAVAPSGPRAGSSWARRRCPTPSERIDTLVLAGGPGADAAAERRGARRRGSAGRRPALPAGGHGVLGRLPRRRGRAARGAARHDPLGPRRRSSAAAYPARHRRPRPDLHPRREVLVERRGHGRHRPLAGARPGGPRGRRGPDGGPLAGHVPAPARRPDPVRLAGVGPARRALDRPGRADARRGRARRRPPPARAGGGGRHERAPLHPGLHRRGRREPRAASSSAPAWRRPAASSRRPPTRSTSSRRAAGSAAPRRCAASSSAISASRPMPTGGGSAPTARRKGHPHDRPRPRRHPALPEVHRARCRRALRGPPAHPDLRHHLRRPRAAARCAARTACSA